MADHDELIRRVRVRAGEESGPLGPGAGPAGVAEAEERLGFALPELLIRVYTEVADGGFGPDYQLFPLVGEGRTEAAGVAAVTAVSAYEAERRTTAEEPEPHWPRGVLPILDWGCGMYAAVDCLRPGAPVLLFEPNAVEDDWADAWFQDAPSLAHWLDAWVNETGWWDEGVADDEAGLGFWAEAAERLAAEPA